MAHLRPDEDAHAAVCDEQVVGDVGVLHDAHHVAHQLCSILQTWQQAQCKRVMSKLWGILACCMTLTM